MPRSWTSLFKSTLVESPDYREFVNNIEMSMGERVQTILRLIGVEVRVYLQSYTSKRNPPRYRKKYTYGDSGERLKKLYKYEQRALQPDRPAHPGAWSDVSKELMEGYYVQVKKNDVDWELVIGNRSSHAVYVEAKDGYFVVTGIMDPGGPVDRAIRRAFKLMGATWKIQNRPGQIVQTGQDSGVQQRLFAYPTPGSEEDSAGLAE